MNIFKVIAATLFSIALMLPSAVGAYEFGTFATEPNGDFIVGPAKTEIVVAPGETKTHKITVKSRIDGDQNFRVYVRDFVGSSNPSEVISFVDENSGINPYFLSDYLSVEINAFTLGLGESLSFDVTISVPEDAEPGGRYGAVLVSALPDASQPDGAGVSFFTEIGSLLLVRVDGDLDEFGYIEDFTVNGKKKGIFFQRPLKFETFFRNAGNVHLIPYGQIVVSNTAGREVSAIPIDAHFSLPDSVRLRSFDWPAEDEKIFLIGRYTAELQMYPGYRDVPEVVSITFWYIPIWFVLAFIAFVFLLSLIHSYFNRRYRRVRE